MRTANQVLSLMNSLEVDLQFTMELETDFPDGAIPPLDTTLWLQEVDSDTTTSYSLRYNFNPKQLLS